MTESIIQYAFAAGEVSPKLFGRSDYEKYDFGLAVARNWFLDYRGGLFTRPGTIFGDFIQHPDQPTRMFKFEFSPDLANTYIVLFGNGYIRFIQDGAYLLEDAKAITSIVGSTVTAAGHGYANGDWVKIDGMTFEVASAAANTFQILFPWGDAATGFTGSEVQRIYTISNPYDPEDFFLIQSWQIRDTIRLTHVDYPIKNLVRSDHTSWAISNANLESSGARPSISTAVASAPGSAGTVFQITAVDANGKESLPSAPLVVDGMIDYSYEQGSLTLTWAAVAGAVKYYIYRSTISSDGANVNPGFQMGYLGQSFGTSFTDTNIIPDFTVTPPKHYNPFAAGAIESIEITNGGSGYDANATTIVVGDSAGTGSGFIGYPVVSGGAIVNVIILHRGKNYGLPTVSFVDGTGTGSGATATAEISASSGTYPRTSAIFQQRQMYASTREQPLTIWGSRPGYFDSFAVSEITNASDSYEFDIDTPKVAPIYHLINMRGGLLMMTQAGIWLLTGTGGGPVTPTDALAEPQTFLGPSVVPPFNIDTDILYTTEKESTVRLLSYNDFSKLYGGKDMSILSNHLFSASNPIVSWAYAETPYRLVWAVRRDGSFLAFTVVSEQNIYAWCPCHTQGYMKDVMAVQENELDITYATVERKVAGQKVKMFEYFAKRDKENVDDMVCVDSAYVHPSTYPATTITPAAASGAGVLFTSGSALFTSGSVGDIIRCGGGKAVIKEYLSSTTVRADILQDITERYPETEDLPIFAAGDWTLDTPQTTFTGLWHLEGCEVSILGDGNVFPPQTVTDGSITLSAAVSRLVVGRKFVAQAKTLPVVAPGAVIEDKLKDIVGAAVRMYHSRGLKYGKQLSQLYEVKDRTNETMGQPIQLRSDNRYFVVPGRWDRNGQMWFVQDQPLPAAILGLVKDVDIGSDPN